jgi:hypothetical protein
VALERRLRLLETRPLSGGRTADWSRLTEAERDRLDAICAAAGTTPAGEVDVAAISEDDLDWVCEVIERRVVR